MYHNFYQIHIAEYQNGLGDGPDWGHWVSRDFIKWTQLPVAIWNDQYYDKQHGRGVYTGADSDKYDGEWEGDKRRGRGVCTGADGTKYDGGWKGGLKHGRGVWTGADG